MLLTFSIQSVKRVVVLLEEAGLRDEVTVILGGYPANKMIQEFTGVDYFFTDVMRAVKLFQELAQPGGDVGE
ncbi:Cobalamin (vitamin B12)-binding domain protein [Acididesulfobacillus acetoxydans]|uniref:Cobalamin (Vitamin B12)-binding domain n=1 Tax=Acididesulfobacillus acetoxydans TaxID=1561005 RepID=A0A8S0WN13_9FIRM|nr:Cobalamin (vitamin B12)-binding domain protein [Acididesulfobacillus acetoxydans]CEJ08909.1 Cobalamin (vitamin B12)-binding domain [Acididesulfobacillus acetoxydans]